MTQYILTIKDDSKKKFFLDLIGQLKFVDNAQEIELSKKQLEFVSDLKNAVAEAESHYEGKKQLKRAKDFLNEL